MRDFLTSIAAEPTEDGRLAGLALADPGRLTEAEVKALGEAMAERERRKPERDTVGPTG